MTSQRRKPSTQIAALASLSCLFVFASCLSLRAQQDVPPNDSAQQGAFNRRDMRDREAALRTKAKTEQRRAYERDPKLLVAQITEDYERIQVLNNELRRAAANAAAALDYKRVSTASAEVRKRASRLRENLSFPEPEESDAADTKAQKPEVVFDAAQMKASLSKLDELIVGFVNNPVFQSSPSVVDAEQATKAGRALRDIIALSADIKRSADRLSRSQDKPE
ncbi:MAG TPA: hypothetical protein VGB73_20330 [Pyrinomonadaceae bacterium]|jgi:hypothetical protein